MARDIFILHLIILHCKILSAIKTEILNLVLSLIHHLITFQVPSLPLFILNLFTDIQLHFNKSKSQE